MNGIREVVLIQPPFVQLNGPYPAPYYLKSFLEKRGFSVTVLDHSIGLFEKIFSRSGLTRIFAEVERQLNEPPQSSSTGAWIHNKKVINIVERFLSEKNMWLASIDRIIAFLQGRDHERGHLLALANGCFPGGPRVDAFLAERGGDLRTDEAGLFASKLLADLADFINCSLDRGFSLVRYTPKMEGSLKTGLGDFSEVQKGLDGFIMKNFYLPMLDEEWEILEKSREIIKRSGNTGGRFLLGLTIPFPGCLSGALVCADSAKKRFGSAVITAAGGGYVNTELRFLDCPDFFEYFDYLTFDRGYGALLSILEHYSAGEKSALPPEAGGRFYKTMYRCQGMVIAPDGTGSSAAAQKMAFLEDEAVRTNFPDYSAVDFSRYLYPVDDANPMHRLWSDGHWLKAFLAHGCYWHSCAFCDITLDYIKNFVLVDTGAFFNHLREQAEQTGVYGIHLCDEAAPVSSLLEFALLNREAGHPLNYWGNIRFEKNFCPDTAAVLAAGGLIGVSGGLEVITESGLKRLGKGIDLESAVKACASFKEAGVLTHAYLIYGYWDEDEQEIMDSAETLRQLFSHGLLDSAFWHKFILTRHSRIYAEKARGLHLDLTIKNVPFLMHKGGDEPGLRNSGVVFSLNDLSFEGEEKYDKYSEGLDLLLGIWMAGETEFPVKDAFPFRVKPPSVAPDLVSVFLDKYSRDRDKGRREFPRSDKNTLDGNEKVLFLGSIPRLRQDGNNFVLRWFWRLNERVLKTREKAEAVKIVTLLETASSGKGIKAAEFFSCLEEICGKTGAIKIWKRLRANGLAVFNCSCQ